MPLSQIINQQTQNKEFLRISYFALGSLWNGPIHRIYKMAVSSQGDGLSTSDTIEGDLPHPLSVSVLTKTPCAKTIFLRNVTRN